MASWLSMPGYLQKDAVRQLILARRRNDPAAFCDAYLRWHGKDITDARQQLLNKARQGDRAAFNEIWLLFLDNATEIGAVSDPVVSRQLEVARSAKISEHADARDVLVSYLDSKVDEYRESKLYDGILTTASKAIETRIEIDRNGDIAASVHYETEQDDPRDEADQGDTPANSDVWVDWDALSENSGASAERLWRDVFLETDFTETSSGKYSGALHDITRAAHRLMLLWLEARLYRERSFYNQEGRALISGRLIRKQIRDYVNEYRAIIARWDKELHKATHTHYFVDRGLESQQLRRLIRQFSKDGLNPRELGWASQVTDVEDELRYQLRDDLRREAFANKHPFASFGLLILKITTSYGTRPVFFARTALVALGIDALLFFGIDHLHSRIDPYGPVCVLSQPHIHQWTDVVPIVLHDLVHYLYIATTSLTTLGVDPSLASYCHGWSSQLLLVLSTAFGYFMLGLLGALLYTQLTQRD